MLEQKGCEIILDGKIIGQLRGEIFHKEVKRAKHFMNVLNGYGIDSEAFNHVILPTCKTIVLHEKDTKRTYKVSTETFNEKSIYKHFKPHRAQRFLEMRFWDEI